MDKHLRCASRKIIGTILKVNKGRTSTNDTDKIHDYTYVVRKEGGIGFASIEDSVDTSTRRLHEKEQRKANLSDEKQYKQYNEQQNNNN